MLLSILTMISTLPNLLLNCQASSFLTQLQHMTQYFFKILYSVHLYSKPSDIPEFFCNPLAESSPSPWLLTVKMMQFFQFLNFFFFVSLSIFTLLVILFTVIVYIHIHIYIWWFSDSYLYSWTPVMYFNYIFNISTFLSSRSFSLTRFIVSFCCFLLPSPQRSLPIVSLVSKWQLDPSISSSKFLGNILGIKISLKCHI